MYFNPKLLLLSFVFKIPIHLNILTIHLVLMSHSWLVSSCFLKLPLLSAHPILSRPVCGFRPLPLVPKALRRIDVNKTFLVNNRKELNHMQTKPRRQVRARSQGRSICTWLLAGFLVAHGVTLPEAQRPLPFP